MDAALVVQSYGREQEYKRGIFCILSFFAHHPEAKVSGQVLLFTDRPEIFHPYLSGLPIIYFPLSDETIRCMRGDIDFVHRVKICVIREAFALTKRKILYVDSDTVFVRDSSEAINKVDSKNVLMHDYEYRFCQMLDFPLPAGKPMHEFFNFIASTDFTLVNGETIKIDPQQISWNAGTIVIGPEHQSLLEDVFVLTDQFYRATKHHGCEQYAFDVVLSRNATIYSAGDFVFHYWPVVQKKIADEFLVDKITFMWSSRSLIERLGDINRWSLALPEFIKGHFLMLRHNAIQAFHNNDFVVGWRWAFKAVMKTPFHFRFFLDLLYHAKRNVFFILSGSKI